MSSSNSFEVRVAGIYQLGEKIGHGSFGEIYIGNNVTTNEKVAIKLEPRHRRHPQLETEYKIYKKLKGCEGVPKVHWAGKEGDYNFMVMDLLGPSIEELFEFCNRQFSLKTVLLIADQMLRTVEAMHTRNYIHRDIKPDNVLIGLQGDKMKDIFLIDYGLAKRYRCSLSHEHIPYIDNKNLTGTARYASLNTHMGIEQSRRDDLETIGLVLMYLRIGGLPWQGLRAKNKKDKYKKIARMKMDITVSELCKDQPIEFAKLLHYSRALKFDEKPDYRYLRRMFADLFYRRKFLPDRRYDWILLDLENKFPDKMNSLRCYHVKKYKEKKKEKQKENNRNLICNSYVDSNHSSE